MGFPLHPMASCLSEDIAFCVVFLPAIFKSVFPTSNDINEATSRLQT
jgi:hypothetical protein